jgi:hypothetical protein
MRAVRSKHYLRRQPVALSAEDPMANGLVKVHHRMPGKTVIEDMDRKIEDHQVSTEGLEVVTMIAGLPLTIIDHLHHRHQESEGPTGVMAAFQHRRLMDGIHYHPFLAMDQMAVTVGEVARQLGTPIYLATVEMALEDHVNPTRDPVEDLETLETPRMVLLTIATGPTEIGTGIGTDLATRGTLAEIEEMDERGREVLNEETEIVIEMVIFTAGVRSAKLPDYVPLDGIVGPLKETNMVDNESC